jgi:uncharacterized protein YndB with AHSA1/START domain
MATTQPQQGLSLHIMRVFHAPRERVFRAWTDPAQFAKWFGPSPDYKTRVVEMEPRQGGHYRIEVIHKGGNVHVATGTYQEFVEPEKLVFTWKLPVLADDSIITIEFRERGKDTELSLTQIKLPNQEQCDKHNAGWQNCLAQLEAYLR